MTPTDDEALARLRAALHTIAGRTPISAGRLDEISVAATEKRNRPVVTIVSAAAAVAAIAAVSAVVVGTHPDAAHPILPGTGGLGSATPSAAPSPLASPVPSSATSVAPGVVAPATATCVRVDFDVTALPSGLAGLTYMLPATPAGYVHDGAWAISSHSHCAE
jgi:hypothetical protein